MFVWIYSDKIFSSFSWKSRGIICRHGKARAPSSPSIAGGTDPVFSPDAHRTCFLWVLWLTKPFPSPATSPVAMPSPWGWGGEGQQLLAALPMQSPLTVIPTVLYVQPWCNWCHRRECSRLIAEGSKVSLSREVSPHSYGRWCRQVLFAQLRGAGVANVFPALRKSTFLQPS